MKITFEREEDKVYRLNELEIGDTFILLYDLQQNNVNEVYIKTDIAVVRLNDGHTMNFTDLTLFQKVNVELIVRGNFDV